MMKRFEAYKPVADFITTWFKVIGTVCAAFYAVVEYVQHQQSVQVERSLAYVERHHKGNTFTAKRNLSQALFESSDQLTILLGAGNLSPEQLNDQYSEFMTALVVSKSLNADIETLFLFYEEVAICVERDLCDAEVIEEFFGGQARKMFNSYYPHVCYLREQWNNPRLYLSVQRFYTGEQRRYLQSYRLNRLSGVMQKFAIIQF